MAYVYRHIRLDKNIPFYIGVGSDDRFKRAYSKRGRNIRWQRIVGKTEYEVDILLFDISWDDAIRKEIEFISLYGRVDLGTGCLVNMTDGGEGALNQIKSEETILKLRNKKVSEKTKLLISKAHKGKKLSDETKRKLREANLGKITPECVKEKLRKKSTGFKHTEETKRFIGECKKGNKYTLGLKRTDESKDKTRQSLLKHWAKRKGLATTS